MATTLFSHVNVTLVLIWIAVVIVMGGTGVFAWMRFQSRGKERPPRTVVPSSEKATWRMPPLTLLKPVRWSSGMRIGMLSMRAYLVLAAVLLLVKAIQLGSGG